MLDDEIIALSIVAGELDNYYYLLLIAYNGTIIDVRLNLYFNAFLQEDSRK